MDTAPAFQSRTELKPLPFDLKREHLVLPEYPMGDRGRKNSGIADRAAVSAAGRSSHRCARHAAAALLVIYALSSGTFAAPDNGRDLSGAQIKAAFTGKIVTDGSHWSAYLLADGTFKSVQMGRSRKGRWKVSGKELCLGTPDAAGFDCWTVARAGAGFVFRTNGGDAFEVTAEAPSPKYRFD